MGAPSYPRTERVADLIREELAEIVARKLKDPRVGFVTFTRVKVSRDMRHASVYVSPMGDEAAQRSTLQGLQAASGFLRSELGRRLRLRYTPELRFFRDASLEQGARVLRLLDEIRRKEEP